MEETFNFVHKHLSRSNAAGQIGRRYLYIICLKSLCSLCLQRQPVLTSAINAAFSCRIVLYDVLDWRASMAGVFEMCRPVNTPPMAE